MSLSNTILLVTLDSGNAALYELQPQHLNRQHCVVGPIATRPESLREIALAYGRQLAHELNGAWFKPGGWVPLPDFKLPRGIARA